MARSFLISPTSPSSSSGPRTLTTTIWRWPRATWRRCRDFQLLSNRKSALQRKVASQSIKDPADVSFCPAAMGPQIEGQPQDIVDAGNDRERYGGVNAPSLGQMGPVGFLDLMQERQGHADDLRCRIGLAKPAWPEDLHDSCRVEQRANDQNNDVAAEDQDRYRPADDVRNREHQKHRAQEQLVGDRVQILAQRCFLLQYAGQEAVQSISDSGGHKDDQRPAIVLRSEERR